MPWCPKCKMEYKEGITLCADCGEKLVEGLEDWKEEIVLARLKSEAEAEKLVGFLSYSGIGDAHFCREGELWAVMVDETSQKKAQKLYEGFRLGEQEIVGREAGTGNEEDPTLSEPTEEEELETDLLEETKKLRTKPAGTYVKKEEQYRDLSSSASMFVIFSLAGFAVLILNLIGIMNFLNGPFPYVLLTVLCVGMLYVGISCYVKAKKVKGQIGEEEELTKQIKDWLEASITARYLQAMEDASLSEEINYLNKTEQLRERVMEQFGQLNESYVDQIVEDFYNSRFGAEDKVED